MVYYLKYGKDVYNSITQRQHNLKMDRGCGWTIFQYLSGQHLKRCFTSQAIKERQMPRQLSLHTHQEAKENVY